MTCASDAGKADVYNERAAPVVAPMRPMDPLEKDFSESTRSGMTTAVPRSAD